MSRYSLDIAIPVLNEEESLNSNITTLMSYLKHALPQDISTNLIIADNGSTDKTPEISKNLESLYPDQVKYFRVERRGVGLALKSVWQKSNADFVGYMDLDLATDVRHIPEAIKKLVDDEGDIVYGTRLHANSKVINRTFKREMISRTFNLILQKYLKISFSDGMCGFKFLKREHLSKIISGGAISDGWFFCTELLAVAEWLGLSLQELPVQWTDDSNSKVNVKKLTIEYLKGMKALKTSQAFATRKQ